VAKASPSARLNSNQGTKSNMDMRPQDLGSVENGSPQRLIGLRQVNRFAVARDALEGDSGWASTSKSCAPRGRRSRTRATAVVDGPLDRHTLIDDALVRRADPPTKRPRKAKYCNAGFAKNTSSTDPCLGWPLRKAVGPGAAVSPADLPIDVTDARRRVLIRGMRDN
jgi:hypothetical protein